MPSHLPPLSPLAPVPAPGAAPDEGHTLTLQLRLSHSATAGRLVVRGPSMAAPGTVHLSVAMPVQSPLVFTA